MPRTVDVEPERTEGRRRIPLIAIGVLALLAAIIIIVVVAGNSSDDDGGARVTSFTDILQGRRTGQQVTIDGEVQAVRDGGRILIVSDPNAGTADADDFGSILVVSKRGESVVTGESVTVRGTVREITSEPVTNAVGRSLADDAAFPEFRDRPVVVATDVDGS
ncbi:MAG: hypothetical protein ABR583_03060 [Gaiellaceae bacterium]